MQRMRGCLWLTAGVVVALLAGAVAFLALRNAAEQGGGEEVGAGPTQAVVVAARPVSVGALLGAEDVTVQDLPVEAIPGTAVGEPADAIGKIVLADLYEGEIIVAERLLDPNVTSADGRTALVLDADQVLMAFPAGDLMSRVGVLKPGDRVDMLFTLDFPITSLVVVEGEEVSLAGTEEQASTFALLESVNIAAVVTSGEEGAMPQALLLTVSPQDALTLKYAKDAGGIVDIVLRAPGAEAPFETQPVDINYLIDRYRISTSRRR
jgi:Flp pilus assembly protein CpaB